MTKEDAINILADAIIRSFQERPYLADARKAIREAGMVADVSLDLTLRPSDDAQFLRDLHIDPDLTLREDPAPAAPAAQPEPAPADEAWKPKRSTLAQEPFFWLAAWQVVLFLLWRTFLI
jgi:hypothetical protein